MDTEIPVLDHETLDPSDWEALLALGQTILADGFDELAAIRTRPVWQPIPDAIRAELGAPLPTTTSDPAAIYADFRRLVEPYALGNLHPRFWGWVIGNGTPSGVLAEVAAALLNANVFGASQAPVLLERQVIGWLAQILGLPSGASGLLVSGGSMANLLGLAIGRNLRAPFAVAERGLAGGPQLTLYGSRETHGSVGKAADLLGLGRAAFRKLPVDADHRLDLAALRAAIAADRAAGCHPLAVVGNLGTVNTGASDDLVALADLCAAEGLWLHVDAAFGAALALLPGRDSRLAGLERADSVAFDLHKWFHVPYEAGCVLVRDGAAHARAFAQPAAPYLMKGLQAPEAEDDTEEKAKASTGSPPNSPPTPLSHPRGGRGGGVATSNLRGNAPRGLAAEPDWPSDLGPQLSRGFRALKVWWMLRELGVERLGRMVAKNLAQARHLASAVDRTPELERLAPAPMNVVCLRHRGTGGAGPDVSPSRLDAFNQELLARLQERGIAAPSSTFVGDAFAIRVAICNHRTTRADLDLLVASLRELGRELATEWADGEPAGRSRETIAATSAAGTDATP